MRLSKIGQGIVAAVVVVWLAAMGFLIANAESPDDSFADSNALEGAVTAIDEQGLKVTAISPADVYGEQYVAGALICPGATEESIGQDYQVDAAPLELGGNEVPEDTSYLLLRDTEGTASFDKIPRDSIDFCSVPLAGYFDTRSLMPLAKTEAEGWALFG